MPEHPSLAYKEASVQPDIRNRENKQSLRPLGFQKYTQVVATLLFSRFPVLILNIYNLFCVLSGNVMLSWWDDRIYIVLLGSLLFIFDQSPVSNTAPIDGALSPAQGRAQEWSPSQDLQDKHSHSLAMELECNWSSFCPLQGSYSPSPLSRLWNLDFQAAVFLGNSTNQNSTNITVFSILCHFIS